jgi:glycosyltransferase involved in cell wall biosynthesis
MERFKVDVLLPYHRVDKYLYSAIESLYQSKGVEIRVILIDDSKKGEEINSSEFKKLITSDNRLEFQIFKTKGIGYANALNESKRFIQSPYVAILNSDDRYHPLKLYNQIKRLERDKSDICLGRLVKKIYKFNYPAIGLSIKNLDNYNSKLLLLGPYGADSTIVVRRRIWLKYFEYPIDIKSSDWALALTIYDKLNISYEDSAIYYYRVHDKQVTRNQSYVDHFIDIYPLWRKFMKKKYKHEFNFEMGATLASPITKVSLEKVKFSDLMQILNSEIDKKSMFSRILKRRINIFQMRKRNFPIYIVDAFKMLLSLAIQKILLTGFMMFSKVKCLYHFSSKFIN